MCLCHLLIALKLSQKFYHNKLLAVLHTQSWQYDGVAIKFPRQRLRRVVGIAEEETKDLWHLSLLENDGGFGLYGKTHLENYFH